MLLLRGCPRRGESESRALADRLGGEERLEDASQRRLIHSVAQVGDAQLDALASSALQGRTRGHRHRPSRRCETFDGITRIISAADWQIVESGGIQRVTAIE